MTPLRTLAFVVNLQKPGARELAEALIALSHERGVAWRQTHAFPIPDGFLRGCDACCVIGGDGTLLSVAREAAREQVPVLGVNRGTLGFLTTFSAEEARLQFPDLLEGRFTLAWRSLLECETSPGQFDLALNDVLIKPEHHSRLVQLAVEADGEFVTEYSCDGLIFSTPTGSTAYNLSAGGPILHPTADVLALTPICPHTLSNRSVIFRRDVRLRIVNRTEGDERLLVAIDGQRHVLACKEGLVKIRVSELQLPLAQKVSYSHFHVLRTKLHWSGGAR